MVEPPSGIRLREATAADGPDVADVHAAAVRELGTDAYDERQVRAWLANVHPERYPIGEPGFRAVVAERRAEDERDSDTDTDTDADRETGTDLVGFGLLDCEPSDCEVSTGRIKAIYVHPDHVREGIGSAILADLEAAARDAGLETLVVTASANATAFYDRRGYEGRETVALEMTDNVSLACLRMRKRLSAARGTDRRPGR